MNCRTSLVAIALAAVAPAWPAMAQRGLAPGTGYIPSEHFATVPNQATFSSLEGPRGLTRRLEDTYRAAHGLARRLDAATTQPSERLAVILFDSSSAFKNYASGVGLEATDDLRGFYDRENDIVILLDFTVEGILPRMRSEVSRSVNPIRALPPTRDPAELARREAIVRRSDESFARIERFEERFFRTVVQHEVAHQVLAAVGALPRATTQPAWLSEGMASLFETPLASFDASDPGVNEFRLRDFREAAAGRRLMPWRQILSDDAVFRPHGVYAATAYAQAWLLTYWAVREQPKKLSAYLRRVRDGETGPAQRVAVFERAFGPLDASFEARLTAFADRLTIGASTR